MRTRLQVLIAAVCFSTCLFHSSLILRAADRTAQWKAVADAQKVYQPKTASAALDDIITSAFADSAYAEALKAILIKTQTDASLEKRNEQAAYAIRTLTAWLDTGNANLPIGTPNTSAKPANQEIDTPAQPTASRPPLPASMRPLLEAALAKTWWSYYQANRWQLLQRTQTATAPSDDFLTWDAPRVLAEAARHFDAALADPTELQRTPISTLAPLLTNGSLPDTYRPTLYDFLVNEAIAFYSAGEQGVPKPENAFTPDASSPLLGTLKEFLAWNPIGNANLPIGTPIDLPTHASEAKPANQEIGVPSTNPTLRVIQLYQSLLRFHLTDTPPQLALADADLARLNWAASYLGAPARERHLAALRAFIKRATANAPDIAITASLKLAELLENDTPAEAVAAAEAALEITPQSTANSANALRNLIARIKVPALQNITTETTWPLAPEATAPAITIHYRNQTKLYFRAYAIDWKKTSESYKALVAFDASEQFKQCSNRPIAKTWNTDLPATTDYRYRLEKFPAPRGLAPGFYLIVASFDKNFPNKKNILSAAATWVSDLAIIHSGINQQDKKISGFVLNATTGEPIPNATVSAWFDDGRQDTPMQLTTTAADGAFSMSDNTPSANNSRLRILQASTSDGQTIAITNIFYAYRPNPIPAAPRAYITFFTDRAIYRPGQSVQFKAVVISADQPRADYQPVAKRSVTVVIDDPNGKEAGKLELTTNDFGSITGSFTIPAGRLTGYYRIHTQTGENGGTGIRIEEYKRPKFEVTIPAPKTAPKLNDTVSLTGSATAYTGAPIDNAKVTWRVQRLIRWPLWCWWFNPGSPAEIAHGTATTDATGKFTVQFTALPDTTADTSSEPIFNYAISTEVTDTTGETRTATRTISVGYTALTADITVKDTFEPGNKSDGLQTIAFDIKTTSLDGEPQAATGTFAIHALKQPSTVPQPVLGNNYAYNTSAKRPAPDINSPDTRNWPIEEKPIVTQPFSTEAKTGLIAITTKLPAGIYRIRVTTRDRFDSPITAQAELWVYDGNAPASHIKVPITFFTSAKTAQPGDTLNALWGTGYDTARARISIEQDGKTLRSFWTNPGAAQQNIPIEITESMRGSITLRVAQVRDNRLATETRRIDIPWDNKKLKITWEHFNSKLTPGGRETWTARITGPDATAAAAEFTAALYDASLDQYSPHNWPSAIAPFRSENSYYPTWTLSNRVTWLNTIVNDIRYKTYEITGGAPYRYWDAAIGEDQYYFSGGADVVTMSAFSVNTVGRNGIVFGAAAPAARAMRPVPAQTLMSGAASDGDYWEGNSLSGAKYKADTGGLLAAPPTPADSAGEAAPDLSSVTARKNLNETAFFFPQLLTDSDGNVRIEFTAPEALTRWKFLAFAHDKQLRSALFTDTAVTAKDLMVQPNPPRFLREGDTVEFTVKITNMTATPQQGSAQLTFADATTLEPINLTSAKPGNATLPSGTTARSAAPAANAKPANQEIGVPNSVSFTLPANSSQTLSWRITIPDGQGFLTYKAVASTGTVSDGEEGFLPVLSRRQLVTESIALPIRDKGTRTFTFPKLAASVTDTTLRNESLTVQMTSNPAWYAVLALPNLMEFPHECSEQLFNRYYANALSAHIVNSDPKIARVFEQWRNTPATDSPLLKNEDLKSVLIEETPWLRTATRESENRRAIARLFDANRTTAQSNSILSTLAERQLPNGLWSWFPGGDGSEYITRYLVAGFARLSHFGIPLDARTKTSLNRAVLALDAAFVKRYAELKKQKDFNPISNYLTSADVYQLYTRSFYAAENPLANSPEAREAYDFFIKQTRNYWQKLPRQSQGHAALALSRLDEPADAKLIIESLRQRAKASDELGMYWADADTGWFWWQAPIETQATMIEAFDEVAHDAQAVSDLQLWLLKQKQTQAWPSTKATADAVYALLLRGTDKLASDALVTVSLGDNGNANLPIGSSSKPEPGTGYYTQRIPGVSVTPAMGEKITVTKTDAGPAWGSVTWQYLQTIDKITPHEGTPLTLKKTLWKQINTASGPTLIALTAPGTKLEPGDTLVVRIELRTDRDMEFVHLKDQRGSGTEPVNVLSGYRWKNGLGYYESTRDTATHFFIDRLNAGTYVFEYPIRMQLRGRYESGIAEIQCMYAPEYNSHSASTTLTVE